MNLKTNVMKNLLLFITGLLISGMSYAQPLSTWTQVDLPTTANLLDIDFPTYEIGYIGSENGELLKTTDGGVTWNLVNLTVTPVNPNVPGAIYDIEFSDINNGYMLVGANGPFTAPAYLYATSDGGNSWTILNHNGNVMEMGSIYSSSIDHLFLGGVGFFESSLIMELANASWTQNVGIPTTISPNTAVVTDMDFYENLGLAATNGQYILRSEDHGQTWDTTNTNLEANATITSILIVDEFIAYAGYHNNGMSFGLLKSEDGGLSWFQDFNSATFFYPQWLCVEQTDAFSINEPKSIYAGAQIETGTGSGFNGMIFESADGLFWNYIEVAQPIHAIASNDHEVFIDFAGNTVSVKQTFAVGDSGYLLTNSTNQLVSVPETAEVKINLYPNPASNKIVIELEDAADWNIQLLDNAMKELTVDVSSSNSKQEINISSFSAGLYYVILTKDGQKITKTVVKE